jgi:hypothetical protein
MVFFFNSIIVYQIKNNNKKNIHTNYNDLKQKEETYIFNKKNPILLLIHFFFILT